MNRAELFPIGDVARLFHISVSSLRHYEKLGLLLPKLKEDDLLMITADHGNDPTHTGTDHTRETVPLLAWSPSMEGSGRMRDHDTFGVIGATAAFNFGVPMPEGAIGSPLQPEWK